MKRFLALTLALALCFALASCAAEPPAPAAEPAAPAAPAAEPAAPAAPAAEPAAEPAAPAEPAAEPATLPDEIPVPAGDIENADDIPDNMTSADNKYQVAFITDVGQLKDKSFNQGTYDGVKLYAANNGKSYKYYQPAGGDQATDDDRYDAMKAAVDGGAEAVVCAGFMQGTALAKAAEEFSDTKFIFIDGWSLGMDNEVGVTYKEEEAGYFAGYAVVREGFEKLGFTGGGGGDNPAVNRYG